MANTKKHFQLGVLLDLEVPDAPELLIFSEELEEVISSPFLEELLDPSMMEEESSARDRGMNFLPHCGQYTASSGSSMPQFAQYFTILTPLRNQSYKVQYLNKIES